MPVPISTDATPELFPPLTRAQVDAARTSAWEELFHDVTAPVTIVDLQVLGEREAFLEWLDGESIFLPEDSGSAPPAEGAPIYRLPGVNAAIRSAVAEYGAVFPKLNWTAPRDAAFLLPQGDGPMHCTSPADVYLLLKGSDFVAHGVGARAYEGASDAYDGTAEDAGVGAHEHQVPRLELVLKKYTPVNPAREVRCFVRDNVLLGITQRDPNFYDHLQPPEARTAVVDAVRAFWQDEVRGHYEGGDDYVFDLDLGEEPYNPTIIDFAPYRESTDPLLFSYEELRGLLAASRRGELAAAAEAASTRTPPPAGEDAPTADMAGATAESQSTVPRLPVFKVVDSASHPSASRAAPAFSTNMVPLEMLQMSEGRTLADFAREWQEAMANDGEASDSDESDDDEEDNGNGNGNAGANINADEVD